MKALASASSEGSILGAESTSTRLAVSSLPSQLQHKRVISQQAMGLVCRIKAIDRGSCCREKLLKSDS